MRRRESCRRARKTCVEVEIDDDQILLERARPRATHSPFSLKTKDWPSKTSSSWPPTQLTKARHDEVVGGARGQHLLAGARLARVIRRGVDGDDELRAGQRLLRRRARRVPDVLADIDGDHASARARTPATPCPTGSSGSRRRRRSSAGTACDRCRHVHAVVEHGGGVEDVVALVDEPDHRGEPAAVRGDVGEGPPIGLDERRLEQEILRGVAGQDQLREGDDVGTLSARARSIQSTTSRALASMAPTVGLTWASATRTCLMATILADPGLPTPRLVRRARPARAAGDNIQRRV